MTEDIRRYSNGYDLETASQSQDQDTENCSEKTTLLKKLSPNRRSERIRLVVTIWIMLTILIPFNLYADYKCTNLIVPTDYYTVSNQKSMLYGITTGNNTFQCYSNRDCGHGKCDEVIAIDNKVIGSECICDSDYYMVDDGVCDGRMLSGLATLIISILFGELGIDLCFLARGNPSYIFFGVVKGLTGGCCGVWYVFDIVLIAMGLMTDGYGHYLTPIMR